MDVNLSTMPILVMVWNGSVIQETGLVDATGKLTFAESRSQT